jgi:hypothetical protein
MTLLTINKKTNKFLFFNDFLNPLLYGFCIIILCVLFSFFVESFFLFSKFKAFKVLNMFSTFLVENFYLLNILSKVKFFNVVYNDFIISFSEVVFQHGLPIQQGLIDKNKVEFFNLVYNNFISALSLLGETVFQLRLFVESQLSHISKCIVEPSLNVNSEFLKKENFLNTKDIFQSFESRFGFKVSDTICTKRCFELMKVEPYLPSPYLTILSAAYREEDCWSANSTYPWDIKKLVDVQTYACDIRQLEKEMSNVLKALSSDLNQKQQTQLDQSSLEFFV